MGEGTMDSFDLKPERKFRINAKALIWNLLTVLVLLGICCQGYFFLSIFMNPKLVPPFLRPQPLPTLFATITPTITPIQLDATWTYTPTLIPSATRTRAPSWTPLPGMISPTLADTPTDTLEPAITATPTIASVEIAYKPSTDYYPASGCNWLGVGGQVLDADAKPLPNQTLQLGGTLDGKSMPGLYISGMSPDLKSKYGEAAFEFVLGNHPIASTQTLWIQLFDNTSRPLTDKIYFDTFTDCARNLIFMVFKKNQ
jgi:hypothetical protein